MEEHNRATKGLLLTGSKNLIVLYSCLTCFIKQFSDRQKYISMYRAWSFSAFYMEINKLWLHYKLIDLHSLNVQKYTNHISFSFLSNFKAYRKKLQQNQNQCVLQSLRNLSIIINTVPQCTKSYILVQTKLQGYINSKHIKETSRTRSNDAI